MTQHPRYDHWWNSVRQHDCRSCMPTIMETVYQQAGYTILFHLLANIPPFSICHLPAGLSLHLLQQLLMLAAGAAPEVCAP
jgi:hypothetical protein